MDKHIQEKAKKFAAQCDRLNVGYSERACSACDVKKKCRSRDYGMLLSLCGVMVCNQFNMGVAQAVCHGMMNVFMHQVSKGSEKSHAVPHAS